MRLFDIDVSSPNGSGKPLRDPVTEAIRAIGAHTPETDWKLDVDAHGAMYRDAAPGLSDILLKDRRVRDAGAAYAILDASAKRARCRYEFSMSLTALLALMFALLAMFVSVVPPDLGYFLRYGIAAVAGFFLAEALIITSRRFAGPVEPYKNRLRLGLPLGAMALQYAYPVVPISLATQVENLRNLSILALVLTLAWADTNSGGLVGWVMGHLWPTTPLRAAGVKVDVSKLPLKQQWYELRGHAEDQRRRFFLGIALSTDGAGTDVASHKLEYIRRYHIEVQQGYFDDQSRKCLNDSRLPETLRRGASAILLGAVVVLLLLYYALESEQSGAHAMVLPDISARMLDWTQSGVGDVAILLSLFAVGVYGYSQLTTALLQKRATHERYSNAWAQLRRATSPSPGVAELALALPLSVARRGAAEGDPESVVELVRQVNRLLAAEFGSWSPSSRYKIAERQVAGRIVQHLSSTARLSADNDFEWITRDLEASGQQRRQARKRGMIRAIRAGGGERLEAHGTDGLQSVTTAEPGDWIATKVDTTGTPVRNPEGKLDQYKISDDRFAELYTRASPTDPALFQPTGRVIEALRFEGGIDIIAAWGEHQTIVNGYLVRNSDDVYGIDAATFEQTYEIVSGATPV